MGSHPKTPDPLAEDETFILLMQVAAEEPEVGERLRKLLALDDFNRKSLLGSWIAEARLKGAPESFVRALGYLRDDSIARQARELIGAGDTH